MAKEIWKPGNMLYPLPAVMASCGDQEGRTNIITVAWTGTVCTNPAMVYISVRPQRYSYDIIRRSGEFVINLTTEKLLRAADWCGVRSGRDMDKFEEMHLTPVMGTLKYAPMIKESPVCIECVVTQVLELGSHDMFIAEVRHVFADEKYMDAAGRFDLAKAKPLAYVHGQYYGIGRHIGRFGFSVQKKKIPSKKKHTGRKK